MTKKESIKLRDFINFAKKHQESSDIFEINCRILNYPLPAGTYTISRWCNGLYSTFDSLEDFVNYVERIGSNNIKKICRLNYKAEMSNGIRYYMNWFGFYYNNYDLRKLRNRDRNIKELL